jgi:hypothetical protein
MGTTIQRCRELQQETAEALALPDLPLTGFSDIDSALVAFQGPSKRSAGASILLHPLQLASIAKALAQALRLRTAVLEQPLSQIPANKTTPSPSSGRSESAHAATTSDATPSSKAASLSIAAQRRGTAPNTEAVPTFAAALVNHASRISPRLQEVVDAIEHAINLQSGEIRNESSPEVSRVRQRRQENSVELTSVMNHWCKELFRQKASTINTAVLRRNRQCCSVKRGSSGVRDGWWTTLFEDLVACYMCLLTEQAKVSITRAFRLRCCSADNLQALSAPLFDGCRRIRSG